MRTDVACREPRCRICRNEAVRIMVNAMLDWRGVREDYGRCRVHTPTYMDILRHLVPINEHRSDDDQITYDCLWHHAKWHYDVAGVADYWCRQIMKDLRKTFKPDRETL